MLNMFHSTCFLDGLGYNYTISKKFEQHFILNSIKKNGNDPWANNLLELT